MDVLMPQLGETVAEGKIVKWFKAAGDAVKPGDNLFEIETDKTSMEVPATFAGTLSDIRFQVGEVAKVGAVVAVIAGAGGRRGSGRAQLSRRHKLRSPPRKRGSRAKRPNSRRTGSPLSRGRRSAGPRSMRLRLPRHEPVARGAYARTQLRAGEARQRRLCHAAGAPSRLRARHRSVARQRLRPARPHRRRRRRARPRPRAAPPWRPAPAPRR